MAPLAGKPPFATDEPDSFYETPRAPQPRIRQPAPPNPNSRTSAYDVYDNYLADDKNKLSAPADSSAASNRNSGIGALGMGLLNMGDDSDSDDDDEDLRPKPTSPPGITPVSKNAALAAATGVSAPSSPTRPNPPQARPPQQDGQRPPQAMHAPNQGPPQGREFAPHPNQQPPHPQQHQQVMRGPNQQPPRPVGPPQPQQRMYNSPPSPNQRPPHGPIAAPRPGYAAPIAALNLARPEAAMAPGGRQVPPSLSLQNPFEPPFAGPGRGPGSPASSIHSSTPHPLQPPVTPITPAFIRPAPSPVNISFDEGVATPRKPIMRGNSEETLLPSRGEKGDDFWRRFSMVAKEDSRKKESSWLKKTRNGSARLSRWVWILGIVLLLCIGGGAGLGVYMTRKSPGHQQPTAIGGSADNTAGPTTSATPPGPPPPKGSSTRLHVTPTNTVARRSHEDAFLTPAPLPTPALALRMHAKRRLVARDAW